MCSTEQMNTKVLDCLLTLQIKVCLHVLGNSTAYVRKEV